MAAKKTNHLGTGLTNIFGENIVEVLDEIQNNSQSDEYGRKAILNINDIRTNPYQPRKVFDDDKLNELAQSIKTQGVFTPILVRQAVGGYELVTGERRLRASQLAGKDTIPAIIMEFDDNQMMEISLLENIQREDLNVIEEANAYESLITKMDYTQEQLAKRLGKSREHVANTLRLLKLPKDVQKLVEKGKLSMGHVRPLITLPANQASALAKRIVEEKLSVRAVEALVNKILNPPTPTAKKPVDPFVNDVTKKLADHFQTKIKITDNSINISYNDVNDLNRLLELLGVSND